MGKIRPQVLVGEILLAALGICLINVGAYEGAIGCAALIGTTIQKVIEDKE